MKKLIISSIIFSIISCVLFVIFFSLFKFLKIDNPLAVIFLSGIMAANVDLFYSYLNKKNNILLLVSLVSALSIFFAVGSIVLNISNYLYFFLTIFIVITGFENVHNYNYKDYKEGLKECVLEKTKILGTLFVQGIIIFFTIYHASLYFIQLY